jgi:fatty-acyl-CoA synthase
MPELTPFATPGDALAHQVAEQPEKEAFVFPHTGERMTFAEWQADAQALARGLLDLGYRPGDHIGILAESRMEWPVCQMAIALMGGVMVPLNSHYRLDDLRYALNHSKTVALFLSESFRSNAYFEMVRELRPDLPYLRDAIVFDGAPDDAVGYAELLASGLKSSTDLPDVDPDAIASLQYTSGTTGFPKGALLTHAGMMANSWGISGRLRVTRSDRWTSIIPMFHCAGCIMCNLGTVQRGSCYVGVSAFDPEGMFRIIEDEKCTVLSGVPTSYLAMLEHETRQTYDLSTLRAGTCGGADTDPALLERCAKEFPVSGVVQVYGQTEASTLISLADCRSDERFETCGPPLPGAQVRIADPESGREVPAGEIGQIETSGPMVMRGYFDNPEATAETIGADGWMRTGDLGFLTPDGNVVVAGGRLRDMIIRGGENIYPVEIENMLRPHPAISDIAVFGAADDYYGEIVAAAVSLNGTVTAEELSRYCDGRIARFKVPAKFYRVDAFPLTASGKVRKTELRELAAAGALTPLP